jgi:hypothetical protein
MRRFTSGLALFAVLCAPAACTDRSAGGTAASPAVTGQPAARSPAAAPAAPRTVHLDGADELRLAVYYLRTLGGRRFLVPEWHPVPSTRAVATAAVGELLRGRPLFPGSRRPFPAGTRLRSLDLERGTLTVHLSGAALSRGSREERRYRLQALVHTALQFRTVKRVVAAVGGRARQGPLVRDRRVRLAPIALAEPGPGARVAGGRLVVKGEASVYEGTVSLRLRDGDGRLMAQSYTTSAAGAPDRGPFSGAVTFTPPTQPQRWTLEVFEVSPDDGALVYWVRVPVWVGR